ncbi:hypothetical protein PSHT_03245 [Puccinia striiformis]|uniref:Uncharacterized protein n=1 Tax=Puccinia striiformis TaxID=27350 RepID=A0A2S4WFX7_9BASI|nr:hypothetical protein PSHT_03245 [Puccinia striiformis]
MLPGFPPGLPIFSLIALSAQGQKHVVYLVLKIIMRHAPWFSSGGNNGRISASFQGIRAAFIQDGFLENADKLPSTLRYNIGNVDLSNNENIRTIILIEQVLIYLDHGGWHSKWYFTCRFFFGSNTTRSSRRTKDFLHWTSIVTARELGHDLFKRPKSRPPNFTLWMGQHCCFCGGPFQ